MRARSGGSRGSGGFDPFSDSVLDEYLCLGLLSTYAKDNGAIESDFFFLTHFYL